MTPVVTADVVEAFVARARDAGHPIEAAGTGLWAGPDDHADRAAGRDAAIAPNDVLDAAREAARARVAWVHAVLPTLADAVRLAAAVQTSPSDDVAATSARPWQHGGTGPAWLRLLRRPSGHGIVGDPRRVPFEQLVAEMPLTVRTLTVHRRGRAVHVTEIPAVWIDRVLLPSEALR